MMTDIHTTPETVNAELNQMEELEQLHQENEESKVFIIQQINNREELLVMLRGMLELPLDEIKKEEVDCVKQQFYKLRKSETEALMEAFKEEGNKIEDFVAPEDAMEEQLRQLLILYKDHRQQMLAERERLLQANLSRKKDILNSLKEMVEDTDNINKHYAQFQELSAQFKDKKQEIPASEVGDIWKEFQLYTEQFYDLLKINKELRDYDFKKNLDHKEALCREAEALAEVEDVVSSFKRLQELHDDWRHTGPVAPQNREELWSRFKAASTVINKKHQTYFEAKKERELFNEQAKTALCEKIEQIDLDSIKQMSGWEEQTKYVLSLQQDWKKLGFASRKMNVVLFERFRKSCDEFFNRKSQFYKDVKQNYSDNLHRKEELCVKAEENKDRTDWKKATDFFVGIQQEWKNIGPVQHKYSDAVWNRFKAACDYFFNQKSINGKDSRSVEMENMSKKRAIIESLTELTKENEEVNVHDKVMAFMAEWKQVGHVPFKDKDTLHKAYQEVLDVLFARRNKQGRQNNIQNFELDIDKIGDDEHSQRKLLRERERLMRQFEQLKTSMKTYENNMGFLSASSKGANAMVQEIERKLNNIKEQMDHIVSKIDVIDNKLGV